jgi:hypothetical protein
MRSLQSSHAFQPSDNASALVFNGAESSASSGRPNEVLCIARSPSSRLLTAPPPLEALVRTWVGTAAPRQFRTIAGGHSSDVRRVILTVEIRRWPIAFHPSGTHLRVIAPCTTTLRKGSIRGGDNGASPRSESVRCISGNPSGSLRSGLQYENRSTVLHIHVVDLCVDLSGSVLFKWQSQAGY